MALHLREFDFGVPIRALHQSHRDAMRSAASQRGDPIQHGGCTLLVRLHRQAQPLPAGQPRIAQHRVEDVEAEFQPVGLFRIDRQADRVLLRCQRQRSQRGDQCRHAARLLEVLVARVQCRQLDRDLRRIRRRAPGGGATDRSDRIDVGASVTLGVGLRFCCLAQHVETIAPAAAFGGVGACEGFVDRAAHHELPCQHAHAAAQGGADHRLAHAADHAGDGSGDAVLRFLHGQHAAGQHEGPGVGVHCQRFAAANMVLPVAAADAVLDQGVGGGGVGDAQQRLGEAEQRNAFGGAQAVFLQEVSDIGAGLVGGAGGTHQAAGSGLHGGGLVWRQGGGMNQRRQDGWFRGAMQATQGGAVVMRHVQGSWGRWGGSSTAH